MKRLVNIRMVMSSCAIALLFVAAPSANHSWNNYHWFTTTGRITLDVGDNVSSQWDAYLAEAISDWNGSTVVELNPAAGGTRPKNCRPTAGRIEACNAKYGNNGWLGIAQIWLSGGHITQAITKLNDTYFDTATYNTPAWRRLVACQEIAHDFGLDHQDETFDNPNLGSCMDYTNDPDGGPGGASNNDPSNEHPNSHDMQQLVSIYNHSHAASIAPALVGEAEGGESPGQWGRLTRTTRNNRSQTYELDLGNGRKKVTHVFWADPEGDRRGHDGR